MYRHTLTVGYLKVIHFPHEELSDLSTILDCLYLHRVREGYAGAHSPEKILKSTRVSEMTFPSFWAEISNDHGSTIETDPDHPQQLFRP
jgi:hypothetical protein